VVRRLALEAEAARFNRLKKAIWPQRCYDCDDAQAAEDLLPLVYDELRRIAAARMGARQPNAHCLTSATLPFTSFPFSILHCSFGGVCNHAAFPE